ncbi:MAG: DUF2299 family protein [Promethearchaeota archaeon]
MKKETIEKLREFAIEEGILGRKLPKKPKLDAAYELNFPPNTPQPQKLTLIFPSEQNAILLQLGVQASPIHANAFRALDQNRQVEFFTEFKKALHLKNLLFSIDAQKLRWLIQDIMYEGPELTKNFFFRRIRLVFNMFMYTNALLGEYCGGKVGGGHVPSKTADTTSFYM